MDRRKQEGLQIYTLGTSQRSLEEFIEILRKYGLKRVIDVRSFPQSKRYPHFSRSNLEKELKLLDIGYFWLGRELGGFRKGGYKAYTQTPSFAQGMAKLITLAQEAPSVIICAEKFPWRCHRRFIAQKLEETGWEVIHILERDQLWRPRKRPLASLMFPPEPSDV